MNDQRGRGFEDFGRRVDETFAQAMPRLEEEVKKVIAYMNDEVVPEVRHNSLKALRTASDELSKLADKWERTQRGQQPGGPK